MGNALQYQGYTALVHYDAEGGYLFGNVSGIRDCVHFEADCATEVVSSFYAAVDEYLAFCAEKGKDPEKPFKGTFNVRVGAELHKRAALKAAEKHESLNQFVIEAIAAAV
ncbi:type II toxin-antitoxin system HicB family antitoxin [Eggerthella sinensis]|uniref:type II toxin-antitoxin system HicB family antitoxin n=1 Tax=Eggerthella sinensis TaxID=242230 RepID=UPI0022E40EA4|nr:type II toxin-antitoxin system HicB family antitoxin [Eggerthella sinensis]